MYLSERHVCSDVCVCGQGRVSADKGLLCENAGACVKGNSLGSGKPKEWSHHVHPTRHCCPWGQHVDLLIQENPFQNEL